MPYSGPASAYGTIGKAEQAYFKMINEQGGVNGRKINLISLDDGYSPPKAVEQVRKLVEQDEVLALFQTLGTPSNTAIHKYVNAKKVPHLFLATGATKWGDPKNYPWTMGFNRATRPKAQIYAKYMLKNKPNAKIAILYQNDDYGKDLLKGVKDGLGRQGAKMIVAEATYEVTDPTVDSQILLAARPRAPTPSSTSPRPSSRAQADPQGVRLGWKPLHFVNNVGASVGSVLKPAGLDKSVGLITRAVLQGPERPAVEGRPGHARMARLHGDATIREGDRRRRSNVYGYMAGADDGAGAQAVRQRSHARERDEAGGQPQEPQAADAAARHHDQHRRRPTSPRSSRCSWRASTASSRCCSAA